MNRHKVDFTNALENDEKVEQEIKRDDLNFNKKSLGLTHFVAPHSGNIQIAEEYRHIKRPLLANAFSGQTSSYNDNFVIVTSSLPGEGKTFTSLNLALSIAKEIDRSALLIDADIESGELSRLLGVSEHRGLSDVIIDSSLSVSDALVKTDIPRLTVLPAGKKCSNVTELLASQKLRDIADEISNRYPDRMVIMDSSPLLVSSASSVLVDIVGQIVMVVEAGQTPKQILEESLSIVCNKDKYVGFVLNKSKQRDRYGYYYYGYAKTLSSGEKTSKGILLKDRITKWMSKRFFSKK